MWCIALTQGGPLWDSQTHRYYYVVCYLFEYELKWNSREIKKLHIPEWDARMLSFLVQALAELHYQRVMQTENSFH